MRYEQIENVLVDLREIITSIRNDDMDKELILYNLNNLEINITLIIK